MLTTPAPKKVAAAGSAGKSTTPYNLRSRETDKVASSHYPGLDGLLTYYQSSLPKAKNFERVSINSSSPAEVYYGYGELSKRQVEVLTNLPDNGSLITLPKSNFNVNDLAALTAKTGNEFAMFTLGSRRMIIRGDANLIEIPQDLFEKLKSEGWR